MKNKSGINFLTLILVVALVAATFFVVKFSEKVKDNEPAGNQQVAQGQEEGPVVLGAADFKEIIEGGAAFKGNKNASVKIVEFSE